MELLTIRAAGFTATVDACAQDEGQLWFLSLLGSQQAVRALWARLVKGETAYLSQDELTGGSPCWLARAQTGTRPGEAWSASGGWRFYGARLPSSSAYHGMLVPDLAAYTCDRQEFLLLARSEEEVRGLYYRFLNRRIHVPLHPSWAAWLWERGLKAGEVNALESMRVHAYRCQPDAPGLQEDLSRAIRRGRLPTPTERDPIVEREAA